MEYRTTIDRPLAEVFASLSAPWRLGNWLPELLHVAWPETRAVDICLPFDLVLQRDGVQLEGQGEVIALEPPAVVAYRFFVGSETHIVRVVCMAGTGGTRVRISISCESAPLAIDLTALDRALAVLAVGEMPNPDEITSEQSASA